MAVTREQMKDEAVQRMKMLHISSQTIKDFKDEDVVNLSENGGFLYWLDEEEEKMVRDFENESGGIVYHVIKSLTEFGLLYSLLYVSTYKSEWNQDREDLKNGICLCYVKNVDAPWCSEYGSIGISPRIGGLVRTA